MKKSRVIPVYNSARKRWHCVVTGKIIVGHEVAYCDTRDFRIHSIRMDSGKCRLVME